MIPCSAEDIIQAKVPKDIFSMDSTTIEEEKEQYLRMFQPGPYNTVIHFLAYQRVILLYEQALIQFSDEHASSIFSNRVEFYSIDGENIVLENVKISDFELGKRYVTENRVCYLVSPKYKKYYANYVDKTSSYSKPDRTIWSMVSYMVPNVIKHFECRENEGYLIVISKSPAMYPLSDILDYYSGSMSPEHVASIVTRLMYFVGYLDLAEINHNAITLDNIFFSPGKETEDKPYSEISYEERRITGILGGWFFSTWRNEKIVGMPKEVKNVCEEEVRLGYSSYKVDVLAVKQLAKRLLGKNFSSLVEPFKVWLNDTEIYGSAYDECEKWDKALHESFGVRRFVPMDIKK